MAEFGDFSGFFEVQVWSLRWRLLGGGGRGSGDMNRVGKWFITNEAWARKSRKGAVVFGA
jgi:hypothetical protein